MGRNLWMREALQKLKFPENKFYHKVERLGISPMDEKGKQGVSPFLLQLCGGTANGNHFSPTAPRISGSSLTGKTENIEKEENKNNIREH